MTQMQQINLQTMKESYYSMPMVMETLICIYVAAVMKMRQIVMPTRIDCISMMAKEISRWIQPHYQKILAVNFVFGQQIMIMMAIWICLFQEELNQGNIHNLFQVLFIATIQIAIMIIICC